MSKKRLKLLHIFLNFIIVSWTCKSFNGGRRSTWNYVNSPFNELLPRCLPEIPRLTGLKLSGEGYANLLMVFEFIHNFGETLSFGKSNKFFNKIYYSKKLSLCHKNLYFLIELRNSNPLSWTLDIDSVISIIKVWNIPGLHNQVPKIRIFEFVA